MGTDCSVLGHSATAALSGNDPNSPCQASENPLVWTRRLQWKNSVSGCCPDRLQRQRMGLQEQRPLFLRERPEEVDGWTTHPPTVPK